MEDSGVYTGCVINKMEGCGVCVCGLCPGCINQKDSHIEEIAEYLIENRVGGFSGDQYSEDEYSGDEYSGDNYCRENNILCSGFIKCPDCEREDKVVKYTEKKVRNRSINKKSKQEAIRSNSSICTLIGTNRRIIDSLMSSPVPTFNLCGGVDALLIASILKDNKLMDLIRSNQSVGALEDKDIIKAIRKLIQDEHAKISDKNEKARVKSRAKFVRQRQRQRNRDIKSDEIEYISENSYDSYSDSDSTPVSAIDGSKSSKGDKLSEEDKLIVEDKQENHIDIFLEYCRVGKLEEAKSLLAHSPILMIQKIYPWALNVASEHGQIEVAKWLNHIIFIGIPDNYVGFGSYHDEAFRRACGSGQLPMAQYLLDNKRLDVIISKNETTVLFTACEIGNLRVAQWINEQVEIIHSINFSRAFIAACGNGHIEVAQWIFQIKIENIPQVHPYFGLSFHDIKSGFISSNGYTGEPKHPTVVNWLLGVRPALSQFRPQQKK